MSLAKVPLSHPHRTVSVAQPRKISRWEALFRVGIAAALLISMGMAWWTLTRELVPLQRQSQALSLTMSRLNYEVDGLERKWGKDEVEQIRSGFKRLRSELFANEEAMGEWVNRLDEAAGPLTLYLNIELGKPSPQVTNEVQVSVVPASISIEVRPMPGATESPYQRLLRFGQQLGTEGKRADLSELRVIGGTSSITRALLVFNLWAGDDSLENKSASIP
jgi:HAMP domain-containing protein